MFFLLNIDYTEIHFFHKHNLFHLLHRRSQENRRRPTTDQWFLVWNCKQCFCSCNRTNLVHDTDGMNSIRLRIYEAPHKFDANTLHLTFKSLGKTLSNQMVLKKSVMMQLHFIARTHKTIAFLLPRFGIDCWFQ